MTTTTHNESAADPTGDRVEEADEELAGEAVEAAKWTRHAKGPKEKADEN